MEPTATLVYPVLVAADYDYNQYHSKYYRRGGGGGGGGEGISD